MSKIKHTPYDLIFVGLLLGTLGVMFLSFWFRPLIADDYCLSVNVINSGNNFIDFLMSYREGVNGRLVPSMIYFFSFRDVTGNHFYRLITFFIFITLIISIIVHVKRKDQSYKRSFRELFFPILFVIWLLAPGIGQAVFWDNSSAVYLWGTVFILMSLFISNTIIENRKFVLLPLALILTIASGTFMEQSIPAVLYFYFAIVLKNYDQRSVLTRFMIKSLLPALFGISFLAGSVIVLSSNANRQRTGGLGATSSESAMNFGFRLYEYSISFLIPCLILIAFVMLVKGNFIKSFLLSERIKLKYLLTENPFLIMALLSILPFYFTGLKVSASRTQFLPFVFFLIFIFKMGNDLNLDTSISRSLKFALLIILLIDSVNAIRSNYYYFKVNDQTLHDVQNGMELKSYEKINALHRTTYLSDYSPNDPKSIWIKDCMTDYIQKK